MCALILPHLKYNHSRYSTDAFSQVISKNLCHIYSAIPTTPKLSGLEPQWSQDGCVAHRGLCGALPYVSLLFLWSPRLARAHLAHGQGRSARGQMQTHKASRGLGWGLACCHSHSQALGQTQIRLLGSTLPPQ